MKLEAANRQLESIIKDVEKSGIKAKGLVDELKGLRALALKEKDPLVTKVLRLTYEYLTEKSAFDDSLNLKKTKKRTNTLSKLRTMRTFCT